MWIIFREPKCQKHYQIPTNVTIIKIMNYQQGILDVEQSSFFPLIFSCSGGAAPGATKVMQRLTEKVGKKWSQSYADAMNYIRTKISFALLRKRILRFRGSRSMNRSEQLENSIGAINKEKAVFSGANAKHSKVSEFSYDAVNCYPLLHKNKGPFHDTLQKWHCMQHINSSEPEFFSMICLILFHVSKTSILSQILQFLSWAFVSASHHIQNS